VEDVSLQGTTGGGVLLAALRPAAGTLTVLDFTKLLLYKNVWTSERPSVERLYITVSGHYQASVISRRQPAPHFHASHCSACSGRITACGLCWRFPAAGAVALLVTYTWKVPTQAAELEWLHFCTSPALQYRFCFCFAADACGRGASGSAHRADEPGLRRQGRGDGPHGPQPAISRLTRLRSLQLDAPATNAQLSRLSTLVCLTSLQITGR
jgi:hypothetical protein